MSADLRERVARAMAREFHGDEKDWREFNQEADAVLAELGLTQAEPVGVHYAVALADRLDRMLGCHADSMPKEAYFEVDAVMRILRKAAPQPQASPQAENLTTSIAEHGKRMYDRGFAHGKAARAAIAPQASPQPQPQAEPVASAAPFSGAYFAGLDYTGRPIYRQVEAPQPQATPQASAEDVALVAKLVMCNDLYALLTNIQNGISTVIDSTSANRAILKLDKARDAMQRIRASLGVGRE